MLLISAIEETLLVTPSCRYLPFGTPEIVQKHTIFFIILISKIYFKVSQVPINVARDRLDILLHFPNDWYKDIEAWVEKIEIHRLPSTKLN